MDELVSMSSASAVGELLSREMSSFRYRRASLRDMPVYVPLIRPREHTKLLLSSLQVFQGTPPIALVLQFWKALFGISEKTGMCTLCLLDASGELELQEHEKHSSGGLLHWSKVADLQKVVTDIVALRGSVIPHEKENDAETSSSQSHTPEKCPKDADPYAERRTTLAQTTSAANFTQDDEPAEPQDVEELEGSPAAELQKVRRQLDMLECGVGSGLAGKRRSILGLFRPMADDYEVDDEAPGDSMQLAELRVADSSLDALLSEVRSSSLLVVTLPPNEYLQQLELDGVCHHSETAAKMHRAVTLAYLSIMGQSNAQGIDFGKGPRDEYYYQHIEHHIVCGAHSSETPGATEQDDPTWAAVVTHFVPSLQWRMAVLLDKQEDLWSCLRPPDASISLFDDWEDHPPASSKSSRQSLVSWRSGGQQKRDQMGSSPQLRCIDLPALMIFQGHHGKAKSSTDSEAVEAIRGNPFTPFLDYPLVQRQLSVKASAAASLRVPGTAATLGRGSGSRQQSPLQTPLFGRSPVAKNLDIAAASNSGDMEPLEVELSAPRSPRGIDLLLPRPLASPAHSWVSSHPSHADLKRIHSERPAQALGGRFVWVGERIDVFRHVLNAARTEFPTFSDVVKLFVEGEKDEAVVARALLHSVMDIPDAVDCVLECLQPLSQRIGSYPSTTLKQWQSEFFARSTTCVGFFFGFSLGFCGVKSEAETVALHAQLDRDVSTASKIFVLLLNCEASRAGDLHLSKARWLWPAVGIRHASVLLSTETKLPHRLRDKLCTLAALSLRVFSLVEDSLEALNTNVVEGSERLSRFVEECIRSDTMGVQLSNAARYINALESVSTCATILSSLIHNGFGVALNEEALSVLRETAYHARSSCARYWASEAAAIRCTCCDNPKSTTATLAACAVEMSEVFWVLDQCDAKVVAFARDGVGSLFASGFPVIDSPSDAELGEIAHLLSTPASLHEVVRHGLCCWMHRSGLSCFSSTVLISEANEIAHRLCCPLVAPSTTYESICTSITGCGVQSQGGNSACTNGACAVCKISARVAEDFDAMSVDPELVPEARVSRCALALLLLFIRCPCFVPRPSTAHSAVKVSLMLAKTVPQSFALTYDAGVGLLSVTLWARFFAVAIKRGLFSTTSQSAAILGVDIVPLCALFNNLLKCSATQIASDRCFTSLLSGELVPVMRFLGDALCNLRGSFESTKSTMLSVASLFTSLIESTGQGVQKGELEACVPNAVVHAACAVLLSIVCRSMVHALCAITKKLLEILVLCMAHENCASTVIDILEDTDSRPLLSWLVTQTIIGIQLEKPPIMMCVSPQSVSYAARVLMSMLLRFVGSKYCAPLFHSSGVDAFATSARQKFFAKHCVQPIVVAAVRPQIMRLHLHYSEPAASAMDAPELDGLGRRLDAALGTLPDNERMICVSDGTAVEDETDIVEIASSVLIATALSDQHIQNQHIGRVLGSFIARLFPCRSACRTLSLWFAERRRQAPSSQWYSEASAVLECFCQTPVDATPQYVILGRAASLKGATALMSALDELCNEGSNKAARSVALEFSQRMGVSIDAP